MIRRAVVAVLLLAFLVACSEGSQPVAPEPNEPQPPPAPQVQVLAAFTHATNNRVEYELLTNGTFQLRYGNSPPYGGTFKGSDSLFVFDFGDGAIPWWCKETWCRVWLAMATLRGDTLRVEYDHATAWLLCNDMMDFEICDKKQALYIRTE